MTRGGLCRGLVLAILVTAPPRGELAAQATGVITGRVISATTSHAIPRASVELVSVDVATTTDALGDFRLDGIPVGVYRLRVRSIGYQPVVRANVVVSSGKPVTVSVRLSPVAVVLEGVEVRPTFFEAPAATSTSTRSLGTEEVRRAPGVQEDVVRSVALLPGVGITTGGRNDLIVRGGAPFENLFVVDGIEVPNINHFGSQGSTGGPLSLINVDFVERADFSAGGFGARWGDRTASMTNISLRDGEGDRVAGEINLSATGAGAILEGPVGRETTFLFSARRSYLDLLFKAAGFSFVPAYWDFQFKSTTRLNPENSLSFLAIGALNTVQFVNDDADDRYDNSRIMAPEQRQYFAGATWKRLVGEGLLTVTVGRNYTRFVTVQRDSLDPPREVFGSRSREGENTLRADLVLPLSAMVDLNLGAVSRLASRLRYDIALDGGFRLDSLGMPAPLAIDTSFGAFRQAAYAEVGVQLTRHLRTTAGVRVDYYAFLDRSVRGSPRLGVQVTVGPATTVAMSGGRYTQAPSYVWLLGDPDNSRRLVPIEADQLVLGLEHQLRPDTRFQFEVYHKWYRNYPARLFRPQAVLAPTGFEDVTSDIPFGLEPLASVARGRSFGAEIFVQKRLSAIPVYGILSASVSRTTFTSLDAVERPGRFDARFLGNLLLGWRPGPSWELSGKIRVASGLPTTPFVTTGPRAGMQDFSQYNQGPRLPTFHALDLRVDKRWSFRRVQLVTYIDVQNVYGRRNVSRYEWDARTGTIETDDALGVLPSIGVNVEF